jgi:hypothetical protein
MYSFKKKITLILEIRIFYNGILKTTSEIFSAYRVLKFFLAVQKRHIIC